MGQTVTERGTQVRQRYQMSLTSIPQQTVGLDSGPQWTASGTAITYTKAGTYEVPFFGAGPPECGGVQVRRRVVSQSANQQRRLTRPGRARSLRTSA